MALHRYFTALCLLCAAFTAAGQTEPVRDFRFSVDNHPFLSLSNPALLDGFNGLMARAEAKLISGKTTESCFPLRNPRTAGRRAQGPKPTNGAENASLSTERWPGSTSPARIWADRS